MEIEIQGIPQSLKASYTSRIRSAKADLTKYKKLSKDMHAAANRYVIIYIYLVQITGHTLITRRHPPLSTSSSSSTPPMSMLHQLRPPLLPTHWHPHLRRAIRLRPRSPPLRHRDSRRRNTETAGESADSAGDGGAGRGCVEGVTGAEGAD